MAHPWFLVDAKCLGLSPVFCFLAGAVDGSWQPGPVLPYGFAIHRVSQVKSIPVCACPVIDTQCKGMGSLLSWGWRSYKFVGLFWSSHEEMKRLLNRVLLWIKIYTKKIRSPGLPTLSGNGTAQRPRLQILQLPHTQPKGASAPGEQSCSRAELLWISGRWCRSSSIKRRD